MCLLGIDVYIYIKQFMVFSTYHDCNRHNLKVILSFKRTKRFSSKVDFLNLGFSKSCQNFTGIIVMSWPVSTCMRKYFLSIFIFSLVFVSVVSVKISASSLSTCVSLSSPTFFCIWRDLFICKWSMPG